MLDFEIRYGPWRPIHGEPGEEPTVMVQFANVYLRGQFITKVPGVLTRKEWKGRDKALFASLRKNLNESAIDRAMLEVSGKRPFAEYERGK